MPKRTEYSFVVPGSPEEVAQRLKDRTRFQLVPSQGSVMAGGDKPLAGHAKAGGFKVALNRRDWLTLLQAVSKGTYTAVEGGTRVEGVTGLPAWITWYLRLAYLLGGLLCVAAGSGLLLGAEVGGAPTFVPLLFGVVALAMTFGIGLNVANADKQVDELEHRVREALGAPTPDPVGEAVSADEAERRRKAAAASKQRQG